MRPSKTLAGWALLSAATVFQYGCAVQRGQETVGAYIDDAAITSGIKLRLADSKEVSATSISVETLKGVVLLSGFAKTSSEKAAAEKLAREVKGVRSVKNEIAVQP